jgi:hypothetical protein
MGAHQSTQAFDQVRPLLKTENKAIDPPMAALFNEAMATYHMQCGPHQR